MKTTDAAKILDPTGTITPRRSQRGVPQGSLGDITPVGSSMFAGQDQIERILMCEDCRVTAQFESTDNPFQGTPRPIPRTTEDDLREREIMREREKLRAEAAGPEGEANGDSRES